MPKIVTMIAVAGNNFANDTDGPTEYLSKQLKVPIK